jgi:ABC-type amino acid transport substrate-binding protein
LPLSLLPAAVEKRTPLRLRPRPSKAPQFQTIEDGVLTVGSDIPFAPFEFREGGELTGFDVELVEEMARRLDLEVTWVDTAFDTIFTQLAAGRFDVVASATTITPERQEQVNFSDPYYRAQQALAVNTQESPDIRSVDGLGQRDAVAVQTGTTGEIWARENLEPNGVQIRSFPEAPDTYTALEAGTVTGVIFDEPLRDHGGRGPPGTRWSRRSIRGSSTASASTRATRTFSTR